MGIVHRTRSIFEFKKESQEEKLTLTMWHRLTEKFNEYKHKRILVIDDEEFCLTMMKSILFKHRIDVDHQVDFCINGLEGLNQVIEATKIGVKYQVIFTDFSMPILDGIEATEKIRNYLFEEGLSRD